jgi:hypothetical protein
MNIHDLREAQVRYENRQEEILKIRENLYQLRSSFVRYFNKSKIANMHTSMIMLLNYLKKDLTFVMH